MKVKRAVIGSTASGQALVLFVLMLTTLLVFTGLALDGGLALAKRRQMQNAADAAALAGARELARGGSNNAIYTRADEYSVQRNSANSFTASYYPGGQALVFGGSVAGDPEGVCVTSRSTYETFFVSLVGISSVNVSARACATAEDRCPAPGYAIWAHAPYNAGTCPRVIDWAGSDWSVTGNVHANGDIYMSGHDNTVNGKNEWASNECYHCTFPHNNTVPVQTAAGEWPVNYDITDYEPGRPANPPWDPGEPPGPIAQQAQDEGMYHAKNGGYTISASDPDGLYYVAGDATISAGGITRNITVVAEGQIVVSGSSVTLTPYTEDGLLLFSNSAPGDPCTEAAISMSGSNSNLSGIIFAPAGEIQVSASGNTSITGSLIGWSMQLSGCCVSLNYSDEFCPAQNRALTARLRKQP